MKDQADLYKFQRRVSYSGLFFPKGHFPAFGVRVCNECVSWFRLMSFQGLSRWEAGRFDPRC